MDTGSEAQEQCSGSMVSEDLDQMKCQPCMEDGNLREVFGMCIDCQDYLCALCFNVHTVSKPARNHQLLDKEQMLQSQIRIRPQGVCTEKCLVHEDEIKEYYCTTHSLLGCTVCITLDHATCTCVQYIPHVAKELSINEEYRQVESELKSALEAFERVADHVQHNIEELGTTCIEALEIMKAYRRKAEETFDKIEAELIEQVRAIKLKELEKLTAISERYKQPHEELQAALAKIEALRNSKQNCSLYTEMMRTKDKLKYMDAEIKEADVDKLYRQCQVKFSPNQDTLDMLKSSKAFGTLWESSKGTKVNRCKDTIVSVKHACDIKVNTGTDNRQCWITGLDVLPDGRLVLADCCGNSKIKILNVNDGNVLAELKLSSLPWDVTAINNNDVAVTLPNEKKIAMVTVGDNNLSIDRYLTVSGTCYGVDYKNGKLAVSFRKPDKVQVLNLQGTVLYTISADKQGNSLFNIPHYLTYGQDDTTLYVSNSGGSNVVCVMLDGTVVASYEDSDLKGPLKPVVDNNGDLYVCTSGSHQVYQISKDCKKVLLTQADGLGTPYSICLSEENDSLYVGMLYTDNVKVYTTERIPLV